MVVCFYKSDCTMFSGTIQISFEKTKKRFECLPDLQMCGFCRFSVVLPAPHLAIVLNLTYHICRYLNLTVIIFALVISRCCIKKTLKLTVAPSTLSLPSASQRVLWQLQCGHTGLRGTSIVKNSQVLHLLLTACRAHVWSTPACLESSLVGDDSTSTISIPVHLKQTTKTVLPWTWSLKATVRLE